MYHTMEEIEEVFEEKHLSTFAGWVSLLNGIPRQPYLFCADAIYCCYLVRKSLSIQSRLISLVFTIFIATINDNLEAFFRGYSFPVFADYTLPIYVAAIWILFNIVPYDFIYSLFTIISPVTALSTGIINGRNVCRGIDLFLETGDGIIYVFTSAVLFAFAKYLCVFFYARLSKQTIRSVFVVLFELVFVGFIYIFFTDIYPISEKTTYSREEMKFVVHCVTAIIEVIRDFVNDSFYGKMWGYLTQFISCIIPYYGKTWIPSQSETEEE